jgi:hypothetical protein
MNLTDELVTQFVRMTDDAPKESQEATVYGTIKQERWSGKYFVVLDGNPDDQLTPVASTANCEVGDRVIVRIKNHQATVIGNVESPSASSTQLKGVTDDLSKKVSTEELNAEKARIEELETKTAVIEELIVSGDAEIGNLVSDNVEIRNQLNANKAAIDQLTANKLDASVASATYATIANLDTVNTKVYNLEAVYGDINTLIFGSATGDTIQTSFANAVIAQLGDAQIKSAMIESIAASKITAGDIITNNVRVMSEDGKLVISDETMQISDENRVRVQIGKDAEGDYSISIWDQNGNLMFSKGGITDSAIKDAIIRNDMISDTANIAAHKLDIDSLFEEINGSEKTIKATKVYFDDEKQTLDVAFKSMETDVSDLGKTVSSQGTQLTAVQGQIASKVWQQDIDTAKGEMSTQYSTLEQDLSGFKSSVSSTYATKSAMNTLGADPTNYAKLNSSTAASYGFTVEVDPEGDWYVMNTVKRDTLISQEYACLGGEQIQVDCEVISNVKAPTTEGGTDASFVNVMIGLFNKKGSGGIAHYTSITIGMSNDSGEPLASSNIVTLPEDARSFLVYIHLPAQAPFTGSFKIRNLRVSKLAALESQINVVASDLNVTNDAVNEAQLTATTAESLVQQLSHSISMLVTDGNGTSLMTQTDDGWTFSTAEIQTNVSNIANDLDALTGELGSTSHTVDVLKQAVDDLGEIAEYVKIGTYEDEPCIELGESDSEFKMRITNTRILFMEGSNVVAHISNQSLHIKKAVIEEELQQGGFVWQVRSNGNMGLIWKGVSS